MNESIPQPGNKITDKEEQPSASRLSSADILKVIAILSVVFIHGSFLLPFSPGHLDFSRSDIDFFAQGFRFCVPVFIFLWAYFMEKSTLKRGETKVYARFYKLLIPFVFWSMVYFIMTADFRHLTLSTAITKYWSGFGWSGQYYFIILFQLILLFPIIRLISKRLIHLLPLLYILSILLYIISSYSGLFNISAVAKISHRPFIYWLPYTMLGIVAAHRNIFKLPIPLPLGILSILLVPAELYFLHPQTVTPYLLPSVFISTMVILSSMETNAMRSPIKIRDSKPVRTIAGYTLGIFCLNPLVILLLDPKIKSFGFQPQFSGSSIVMPVLSTLLITGICILLIFLLKRIKLGFLVST